MIYHPGTSSRSLPLTEDQGLACASLIVVNTNRTSLDISTGVGLGDIYRCHRVSPRSVQDNYWIQWVLEENAQVLRSQAHLIQEDIALGDLPLPVDLT